MEEPKRFLRHVMPGLVFLIELAIYLWLPDQDLKWITRNLPLSLDSTEKLIGTAIFAVFVSGGLGYLLSIIYHTLVAPFTLNYGDILSDLVDKKVLDVHAVSQPFPVPMRHFLTYSRKSIYYWAIGTALWHSRRETSQKIKGASPRADSLFDLCHSAGATLTGSVLAMLIARYFSAMQEKLQIARFGYFSF